MWDVKDAQQAMRMMTGVFLGSRAIRCNWANQKSAAKPSTSKSSDYESILYQTPSTNTTIYVGNIAPDTTEVMVRDVFEEFGAIEDVRIQGDKGYAFVKFQTHQTAADAIINGTGKIMGMRTIRCSWGKEKSAGDSVTVPVTPMMGGYSMMMNPMMMMPGAGMGGYGMMGQGNMAQMGMYGMPQMGMYGMPQTQMYQSPSGNQNRQGGQRK
jgi:nucleolysin TIA-1/TIAR